MSQTVDEGGVTGGGEEGRQGAGNQAEVTLGQESAPQFVLGRIDATVEGIASFPCFYIYL